jgi:hypothetical protein
MSDDLVNRLFYRVNNPSAWPEGFDQSGSNLFGEAANRIEAQEKLIQEVEGYLVRIAEMDEVDAALDPTHAIRVAGAARRLILSKAKSQQEGETE